MVRSRKSSPQAKHSTSTASQGILEQPARQLSRQQAEFQGIVAPAQTKVAATSSFLAAFRTMADDTTNSLFVAACDSVATTLISCLPTMSRSANKCNMNPIQVTTALLGYYEIFFSREVVSTSSRFASDDPTSERADVATCMEASLSGALGTKISVNMKKSTARKPRSGRVAASPTGMAAKITGTSTPGVARSKKSAIKQLRTSPGSGGSLDGVAVAPNRSSTPMTTRKGVRWLGPPPPMSPSFQRNQGRQASSKSQQVPNSVAKRVRVAEEWSNEKILAFKEAVKVHGSKWLLVKRDEPLLANFTYSQLDKKFQESWSTV
eukprot:TRINITY_DN2738_c0_g1_i2.p1 TRINITY_DN2738_c0_g1~~TRINITY_DN2738_c0_g1_i2.p1  ORF type:complete len:321 (+),score=34.54 TRINITY_DN2738_c0_g1_i2:264-1226(+)